MEVSAFIYPDYPFPESKKPLVDRLSLTDIPPYISSPEMVQDLFPHVKSQIAIYLAGVSKKQWNDFYECMYVYCCEFNIPNLFFVWSEKEYFRMEVKDTNWRNFFRCPDNFLDILCNEYNLGSCIPLIGLSVRNSLLSYASQGPFQLFVSPGDDDKKSAESKRIPAFNFDNIPAFDVINERNLSVFCHASLSLNIGKFDHSKYISSLLKYCTGHCIKGAVFHVGISTGVASIEEARQNVYNNIVIGIRGAIAVSGQTNTCKFLLETPSGKGNEMFSNIFEFISFSLLIYNQPDLREHFAICVDTCHVHQCGYSPYSYILEVLKYLPIGLVHFNDSCHPWFSRKDLHEFPGRGRIPWIYLMKVAQICKLMNIPMVLEK